NYKRLKERHQKLQDQCDEFFELVSTNDVPELGRAMSASRNAREGFGALISRVKRLIQRISRPRSYTAKLHDLSTLFYELGGAGAVYAANHALTLPSMRVIQKLRAKFKIAISVAAVRLGDVSKNISVFFGSTPSVRVLHTLALDEINAQSRTCYMRSTDEIGGLCREHVGYLDSVKMGDTLDTAMDASKAVREGRVHIGKEVTCAAIFRHAAEGYGAKPVLLSSTCKQGKWEDGVRIMKTILEAWALSPDGATRNGPLGSISSDGDSQRRLSMYYICMERELGADDSITRYLQGMTGLNLYTGIGNITMDFDYKHIFKRVCTLLCSKEGLLVNGVLVNKLLVAKWLEKLTGHDWSDTSIHALLNPKDAQDVPRAVLLLQRISDLAKIDANTLHSPSEQAVLQAFRLLGGAIEALLEPFLNRALSLSEQLESLSKAAHIFCALYRKHGTSFMSNQLYGDIQCMIKNAFFSVARTQ
ncbi:hypothetical protein CYLTODRAFT_315699, partial [Cylindrobasidium torrendii FP15055 ss-10]